MTLLELSESGRAVLAELSPEQAAALAASGVVRIEQGRRPGLWRVSGRRLVGAARIGGVDVRITPKTPISRLLFLLGYAAAPGRWWPELVQAAERDGLLGAVAYAFVRAADRALRNGALQDYRSVEDTLPVVRGRIRVAEQVRRQFGRCFPVEVAFEEFTEDIPENQILHAAARRLLRLPGVPAACRPGLRRIVDALADVADLEHGTTPPVWRPGEHNARFHGTIRLAELVLRGASYDLDDRGAVLVDGLLLNMEKVFEDFVGAALAEALRPYGGSVQTQSQRYFLDQARQIALRPDVVWTRPIGRPAGVADAKYKLEKHSGYPNADVYQMTSYCIGLGLTTGHLIYAAGELPAIRHVIRNAGILLVRHAVPLDAEPGVLLAAIEQIAADIAGATGAASPAGRANV